MPISINGTGSITGLSAGGLPDASVTADDIASNAVTTAKVNDASITYSKLSTSATEADNVAKRTAQAWVNFNGTGTVVIRASFNVSSITDNGTGDYTVNFTTALTDANYSVSGISNKGSGSVSGAIGISDSSLPSTTAVRVNGVIFGTASNAVDDKSIMSISVFR
jgi:hypothetical protein